MEKFKEELESLKGRAIAFIKQKVKNLKNPRRVLCGNNRVIGIFPREQEVVIAGLKGEMTVSLEEFLNGITVKGACMIADELRG